MQNPVRLWAAFRGQSKDLYPINRFGGGEKDLRQAIATQHVAITAFFGDIASWHAPRIKRIILPPKATFFEARFRDGYPEPRFTFWCHGGGVHGGEASGGQGAMPFGIPPP